MLAAQFLHINLRYNHLLVNGKTLVLFKQHSILVDHGIAAVHHVLRTLSESAGAVYVARHGTCALLAEQALQIMVFSYQLVGGGEVEDDVGACQRQLGAGGSGSPHVLADLHTEGKALVCAEHLHVGGQLHGLAGISHLRVAQVLRRSKPAFLVELTIVGQIGLWHDAKDLSSLHHYGAVQEQVARHHGSAHDGDNVLVQGEVKKTHNALLTGVQQHLLAEEVLAGIARHRQFGEHDCLHVLVLCLGNLPFHLLQVERHVSYPHRRNGTRHLHISVSHNFKVLFTL